MKQRSIRIAAGSLLALAFLAGSPVPTQPQQALGAEGSAATTKLDTPVETPMYLFAYATGKNRNKNGLHYAYSRDKLNWFQIGPETDFLHCDYGPWGPEKRLIAPSLTRVDGVWHAVWQVNETDPFFGHTTSDNLVDWIPQDFFHVPDQVCWEPLISYENGAFVIRYRTKDGFRKTKTKNFLNVHLDAKTISKEEYERHSQKTKIALESGVETGQILKVSQPEVDFLIRADLLKEIARAKNGELAKDDPGRFRNYKPAPASLLVDLSKTKPISDKLFGIFFEDINYAADGGLYAELVQNRDFEYRPGEGRDRAWGPTYAWKIEGDGMTCSISEDDPIHKNNSHFAILETTKPGAAFANTGYDGIPLKKNAEYEFSLFAKTLAGNGKFAVRLVDDGRILAQAELAAPAKSWKKLRCKLTASDDAKNASLQIVPLKPGKLAVDLVSLFPRDTFRKRRNGIRRDLAETIAALKPAFMRFPGGCLAHGNGLENIFNWKDSIGPLEARKHERNIWGYHQSKGLGFYELFQFCEDLGCEPLPVLSAGVPCQNSGRHSDPARGQGQQCGIPMEEMDAYIQDILDLIEWANGAPDTKWGAVRAAAGHPKPFNLKYLGIGNEDLISKVFETRFRMIFKAIKEKHPEITVIGTVGPWSEGPDYVEGWRFATEIGVPMVDEHYYQPPAWFLHNQDFYDKYDRARPSKVYLGEYAAHVPGRHSNMEASLAEAIHLTTLERNGDVVLMSSYAPLLAREGRTQWRPDLIYFNGTEVKPSVNYFVQKLFGTNSGDRCVQTNLSTPDLRKDVRARTAFSTVIDSKSGDLILKLVNMLPVERPLEISIPGLDPARTKGALTVLAGMPHETETRPVESEISVSKKFQYAMPPYSLSVIRVPGNHRK